MKSRRPPASRKHPLMSWLTQEGLMRLERGHPWLRVSDLQPEWRLPMETQVLHLGEHWFLCDSNSALRLRRLGPSTRHWLYEGAGQEPEYLVTSAEVEKVFRVALRGVFDRLWSEKAQRVGGDSCFRWCFADADGLPGLVLDVFGEVVVAERTHPFWEKNWAWISRELEEVSQRKILLSPTESWVTWNGFEWKLTAGNSHKTGMYLDQRDNHKVVAAWAQTLALKSAWDLFSYVGGFSLHLARAGLSVTAVDASESALATLLENAQRNHFASSVYAERADVFVWLQEKRRLGEKCDLIVLDPPSLAPKEKDLEAALRALRDLSRAALGCLNPGGLLVLCVCSHHLSREKLLQAVRGASHDVRASVQELAVLSQASDHAPLASLPESRYLNGSVFQVGY